MDTPSGPCKHNADLGCDYPCIACDPTPDDERLRSIGWNFGPGGKRYWHDGQTVREAREEIFAEAKRFGIEPEPQGKRILV